MNETTTSCGHEVLGNLTTCGECGGEWCATCEPTPAARCPFEYDHEDPAEETVSEYEALDRYREMLDEVFGTVMVAGGEYDTSRALEELDPIAFRCGFNDWISNEGIDLA